MQDIIIFNKSTLWMLLVALFIRLVVKWFLYRKVYSFGHIHAWCHDHLHYITMRNETTDV
jgi:preprotein translocase subunit SecF